jgi:hypothetical protein
MPDDATALATARAAGVAGGATGTVGVACAGTFRGTTVGFTAAAVTGVAVVRPGAWAAEDAPAGSAADDAATAAGVTSSEEAAADAAAADVVDPRLSAPLHPAECTAASVRVDEEAVPLCSAARPAATVKDAAAT